MGRVLGVVGILLLASPAVATVLVDHSVEDLVAHADRIVIGTVHSQRTERRYGHVMTETTVLVERTLLGEARPSLKLWQMGGVDGTLTTEVPGDARLRRGQRVVLFTRKHTDGRRYLYGMALGVWHLDGDRAHQSIDVPVIHRGQLRPSPGRTERSLEDLLLIIRRAR